MNRKSALILLAVCFTVMPLFAPVQGSCDGSNPHGNLPYVPGEILVKYKPSVSEAHISASSTRAGMKTIKHFKHIGVRHVKLPANISVPTALALFKNDPSVEYAEPNYRRYVKATPDDTYYDRLWGLNNTGQTVNGDTGAVDADMDAPEAWDTETGSNDIIVAVIDSGVAYDHEDLSANIWTNIGETADNSTDDDGNGYEDDVRGWDFVDNDNDPMDPDGHGTHVAGTIAAVGDNATGITGVCWTAKIMPLRTIDAYGSGTIDDEIEAITYARQNGAKIINASFGSTTYSQAERDAINEARSAGVLFVAAAGNDGTDNDAAGDYPAGYNLDNIVAVASTDQDDSLSVFSNYGTTSVDVAAPGENIYSTQPDRQNVWTDNFDDDDISDWSTGGTNNTWGTTNIEKCSGSYSLTDSPGTDYQNNTNSWARFPDLDLSSHHGTTLAFKIWGSSEAGNDSLFVEASINGTTWTNLDILVADLYYFDDGISGSSSIPCLPAIVDLGAYDGENTVYIRFRFETNGTVPGEGLYIDDVAVTAADSTYVGTEYQYLNGTSMATPHAAGLAALIWSTDTGLTYQEIKERILYSVDPKLELIGTTVTGGRVNANKALNYVSVQAPTALSASTASITAVNLSWTDNASNEAGFRIERKMGASGRYVQVASVTADSASYSDTGLTQSTTYYYRVRAYSDYANSAYSNTSSAATVVASGSSSSSDYSTGCFIATAAYGSYMDSIVHILCHFRDRYLTNSSAGRAFIRCYHTFSPSIAEFIAGHDGVWKAVRLLLLPFVGLSWVVLHYGFGWYTIFLAVLMVTASGILNGIRRLPRVESHKA